ncbi:DNA topoisomerase I, partial [Candidatus Poribacteria bacterium]|nr:DNA topoisomerase I [Candidatus Poribacteria bacterium]
CKNTKELNHEEKSAGEPETTDEICDKCGSQMVIKTSRYGKFLACSAYPKCKNTKQLGQESVPDEPIGEKCEKCGSQMVIKTGRYGKFIACSKYPECKTTRPISTGVKCPKPGCDGDIVEKRSKRGKMFYGCNKYPECDYVLWNKPVNQKCPKCGAKFLVEKYSKAKGNYLVCANNDCEFSTESDQA